MADGEHTLKLQVTLSDLALRHLKDRAEKLGMTPDAAAADVIEQQLFDYDDYDWGDDPENDPRTATMAPYDRSEPTYSVEEVMALFHSKLPRRVSASR